MAINWDCPSEVALIMARNLHDIRSGSQRGLQVASSLQFEKAHLVLISVFRIDQDTKLFIHVATKVVLVRSVFDKLLVDKFGHSVNWFVLSLVKLSNEVPVEPVEAFAGAGSFDIRERLGGRSPTHVRSKVYILQITFTHLNHPPGFHRKYVGCGSGLDHAR